MTASRLVASGLALLALAGCGARPAQGEAPVLSAPAAPAAGGPTLSELDQRCMAFADRYATLMAGAVDGTLSGDADPLRRREAHRLRAEGVAGIYDIATGTDPFSKLLDEVLLVTLQSRIWIDELTAERAFGERSAPLVRTLRRLRVEVWEIAAQALTPEQMQELDALITSWRRRNPEARRVEFLRLDDVGASRGCSLANEVREGGGLFAPVDRAVDVAERTRQLGERLFWLSKRAPSQLSWQLELAIDDALLRPEVRSASQVVAGLPALVASERAAVLAGIGELSGRLAPLAADARATCASLAEVAATAERLAALFVPAAGSASAAGAKPFDVAEYGAVLAEANRTLREANQALGTVHGMLGSGELSQRLQEFNGAARERVDHVADIVTGLMWRALGLMVAFFVLLGAYRWWTARLKGPR